MQVRVREMLAGLIVSIAVTLLPGLEHALEAGLRFFLARQSAEGSWSDWDLPPGESRSLWLEIAALLTAA